MPYGNLLADVVQGSTANTPPVFKDGNGTAIGTLCRAWVNFNGTGTVAIRASFNVSSITDNGAGNYTVNFTNAMPDANYSAVISTNAYSGTTFKGSFIQDVSYTANSFVIRILNNNAGQDDALINAAIFR
jgi:hypothetical protein